MRLGFFHKFSFCSHIFISSCLNLHTSNLTASANASNASMFSKSDSSEGRKFHEGQLWDTSVCFLARERPSLGEENRGLRNLRKGRSWEKRKSQKESK